MGAWAGSSRLSIKDYYSMLFFCFVRRKIAVLTEKSTDSTRFVAELAASSDKNELQSQISVSARDNTDTGLNVVVSNLIHLRA